jgi:hypothetical protein
MPKITKRLIDELALSDHRETVLWDDELPGFGLRIKVSGAKSFLDQYPNTHGRSRRLTLGRYGVLTPDEGRRLAKKTLADVARGLDPAEVRQADRRALTVAELCREYGRRRTLALSSRAEDARKSRRRCTSIKVASNVTSSLCWGVGLSKTSRRPTFAPFSVT